jgi:hypothetical protein
MNEERWALVRRASHTALARLGGPEGVVTMRQRWCSRLPDAVVDAGSRITPNTPQNPGTYLAPGVLRLREGRVVIGISWRWTSRCYRWSPGTRQPSRHR